MGIAQITRLASRMATLCLTGVVYVYRFVFSPLFGGCCRYQPTCSSYALDALRLHTPIKASGLIFRRVISCHPWGGSGVDPVPRPEKETHAHSKGDM